MADKNSLEQIPEGWKFETKTKRDGSEVSHYICHKTGQRFYTYEDMMRYVNYAKEAGLPVYIPEFDFRRKKKKPGQSSESAHNQIEKSLDMEEDTDIEKSLDSEEDTDTEKSLDSGKGTDVEELDFPGDDPSENLPASEADTLPREVQQEPMQPSNVQAPAPAPAPVPVPAPAVQIPRPRVRVAVPPKSFRNMKRFRPGMRPHQRFF